MAAIHRKISSSPNNESTREDHANLREVVQVVGGLGNQLFQFAFAWSLARQSNRVIELETSTYSRYRGHEGFLLSDLIALSCRTGQTNLEISKHERIWAFRYRLLSYFPRLYPKISGWQVFKEMTPFVHQGLPAGQTRNRVFIGFWQSWKYFATESELLRVLISEWLKIDARKSLIGTHLSRDVTGPLVMLHVRRGDYVGLKDLYGLLGEHYYSSAIELVRSRVKNPMFVVFSDDPNLVRQESFLPQSDVVYFDDREMNSVEVLGYMAACSHFITANSTFSWWAAFLGKRPNSDSIVVSPDVWLAGLGANPDLVPKDWIAIPARKEETLGKGESM